MLIFNVAVCVDLSVFSTYKHLLIWGDAAALTFKCVNNDMFSCFGWFELVFMVMMVIISYAFIWTHLALKFKCTRPRLFCVVAWFLFRGFSVGSVCIICWTAWLSTCSLPHYVCSYTVTMFLCNELCGKLTWLLSDIHIFSTDFIFILLENYLFIWHLDERLSSLLTLQQCRFDAFWPARAGYRLSFWLWINHPVRSEVAQMCVWLWFCEKSFIAVSRQSVCFD